jgi:hypothetical protein
VTFNEAAVDDLFNRSVSHVAQTGYFSGGVFQHEPKAAPSGALAAAVWVDSIAPVQSSGLASTSGLVTVYVTVYESMLQDPQDSIDPTILKATTSLMNGFTGDFDLGQSVRGIDLLGSAGKPMSAQMGYRAIDNKLYRCMDLALPVIINDLWTQAG